MFSTLLQEETRLLGLLQAIRMSGPIIQRRLYCHKSGNVQALGGLWQRYSGPTHAKFAWDLQGARGDIHNRHPGRQQVAMDVMCSRSPQGEQLTSRGQRTEF